MPVVPVTAATAVSKDVPIQLRPIGNVESLASIPVKAQIAGELVAIHFKEGQDVQKGALLFEIDRRPYEQALRQAEANFNRDVAQERQAQANLARDVAQAKNAGAQADRYAQLAAQGVVSKEQNDQMRTSSPGRWTSPRTPIRPRSKAPAPPRLPTKLRSKRPN